VHCKTGILAALEWDDLPAGGDLRVEVVQLKEHVDRRVPPPDAHLPLGFGCPDVLLVDLDIRRKGAQDISCAVRLSEDIDI
jgi:hypothetical protein